MEETHEAKVSGISDLTKLGHKALSSGSPAEACEIFLNAYKLAEKLNNNYVLRGCCFNLGACYVASGQAKIGLKYLEKAIPEDDVGDGVENHADLWYNIGVARHAIGDIERALMSYEKALLAYEELDSRKLEGECVTKLAVCYHLLGQPQNSYEFYNKAQELYGGIGDKTKRAICLLNGTAVLAELGDIDKCARVLDVLLDVCQEVEDKHLQAKIYHDIGLLYVSERLYESAGECFEQSLKCLEQHLVEDKLLKATILQNIGASSNYLKLFNEGLNYHQAAAEIYAELGDRLAQTQVYGNLAFAHAELGSYSEALSSFQHSIEAAKDCGDKQTQCLATEGIAALYFRIKDYDNAINSYKSALVLLPETLTKENRDAERIVSKLTDAIQSKLKEEGNNVERSHADSLVKEYRGEIQNKRQSRLEFPHNIQQTLVARGLDDVSSFADSSDQESGSDKLDDSVEVYEEIYRFLPNKNKKKKFSKQKSKRNLKNTRLKDNGMNFSMKSTLSKSHYYEQPETNSVTSPDIHEAYASEAPRADSEYRLATLAVKRNAQIDSTPERKESSKMCSMM